MNYRRIDVHHHVFPPSFKRHPWDIDTDISDMDFAGIDGIILSCPLPLDRDGTREVNDYMARSVQKAPGRYGFMASIPFEPKYAVEEIRHAFDDLGADGISLPTHNGDIYIGSDIMEPVFAELNRRAAVVFVHPCPRRAPGNELKLAGADDSVFEYTFETTRAVMNYIYTGKHLKYPNVKWVLSHGGGTIPYLSWRLSHASEWHAIQQTPEEILPQIRSMYYDTALCADGPALHLLKETVGTDHILFGTDYPPTHVPEIHKDIKAIEEEPAYSREEKSAVLYGNAVKLFPRFAEVSAK